MKVLKRILLLGLFILTSCSVKQFIPAEETLYKGATFKIISEEKRNEIRVLKKELEGLIRPQPNSSNLAILSHYKVKKENPSFWYKFINKAIGETPVYISNISLSRTKELIKNRLENKGYFYSLITSEVIKKAHSSSVVYTIKLNAPYRLETYQIDTDSLPIYKEIANSLNRTLLKKGTTYNLENLKQERERIDTQLKSKGYYNFNSDFLLFEADTSQYTTKKFDLYLRLKKDVPKKAIVPYAINSVNVHPRYGITSNTVAIDTTTIDGINFIQDTLFFKPKRLRPFVLFKKGQKYAPRVFKATSRRLSSIGTYKFINVKFDEHFDEAKDSIGLLNTNVYLSPTNKRSLSAELQANSKSNGFNGPTLAFNYTNRNIFKGGEFFKITSKLGYEAQINTGSSEGLSSTQLELTGDLVFPRLLFPVKIMKQFKYAVPKTKMSLGLEYLNRSKLYSLSSFNASFGYVWNANSYVYHEFNPVSTSFVKLSNSTAAFNAILEENLFLKNSFNQQLISGLTYNFTYSELANTKKKHQLFFHSNVDIAGNILSLFSGSKNESGKGTILGLEYAQYVKVDADMRFRFHLGKSQMIATRLYGGVGVPYGNSTTLPFSKQFFSGGPYSVRAFRTRSIGPGSYNTENTDQGAFFDRSGDIKLEGNIEYRFPIYSYLKGALFVDAGNVWLFNDNDALPGGKFSSNFINELAVGTGVGLRVDIQSFVIRFDWAVPLSEPFKCISNFSGFDIKDRILNFAIGYPF